MARRTLASKRFAEAIASIASSGNSWSAWIRDMHILHEALLDDSFRATIGNPHLNAATLDVIEHLKLGADLQVDTRHFLAVMARRRSLHLLPEVIEWFGELADRASGIRRVIVTAATELSGEEVQRVRERVAGAAGDASNVSVTVRLDPEILGGLTIREGDQIFDYSVRTRLEVLRERMS
ncbi:MAG: ATP synthase F1 subunit delta [Chloroflexi bacterium]|nr:ATP synthase F1 subunit delta [Chloroflexota bacterium]